jgi:hypothetical protein
MEKEERRKEKDEMENEMRWKYMKKIIWQGTGGKGRNDLESVERNEKDKRKWKKIGIIWKRK